MVYGTLARDPEGLALLRRHGVPISSTAERDSPEPEKAGFFPFPAIVQGDVVRAREVLEHIKGQGCPDPANQILDASGDAALLGGMQHGHPGIVRLLLGYGGDPKRKCTVPMLKDVNMTYFNMALLSFDKTDNAEEIVNALIDGGGMFMPCATEAHHFPQQLRLHLTIPLV